MIKQNKPRVSVVITCYNYAGYITEAIKSIVNQTYYDNIELIVINDGSTDESDKVIRELKSKYGFKYITRENKGIVYTRNEALAVSNGKYLCFLDADDYFEPGFIEALVEIAEKYEADVVYPNWRVFGEQNYKTEFAEFELDKLIKHEIHCTAESLIKLATIGDVRFESEVVAEDWDFFLGLALKGNTFKLAKDQYINYRVRSNTRSSSRKYWDDMYHFYKILQKWQKKYPSKINPVDLPIYVGKKRDEFIDEQGEIIKDLEAKLEHSKSEAKLQADSIRRLQADIDNIKTSKAYKLATKAASLARFVRPAKK